MSDQPGKSLRELLNELEAQRDTLMARAMRENSTLWRAMREAQQGRAPGTLSPLASAVMPPDWEPPPGWRPAPVVVNPGGDPEVRIDVDFLGMISAWSFKPVGNFPCPGCNHRVEFFARHIGWPFFGHRQISCGCRLARHAAEEAGRGQGMCGCEWTKDDDYGPVAIP